VFHDCLFFLLELQRYVIFRSVRIGFAAKAQKSPEKSKYFDFSGLFANLRYAALRLSLSY